MMGSFDLTLMFVGLTLLGGIVPTALYIACTVCGAKRKLQRPCVAPTAIMFAMGLMILLGYASPVLRENVLSRFTKSGEAELRFSWFIEALASVGFLILFITRKVRKQDGRHAGLAWLPGTPTLFATGVMLFLLVAANLCTTGGIGWPWAAYVPPSAWSFEGLKVLPVDEYSIVGDVFLATAIICGVGFFCEWWLRRLRRTGAKWYQFRLGTLCAAVFVASILLWANVSQQGWPVGIDGHVQNLAVDLMVAFLPLLACWVGCEWLYGPKVASSFGETAEKSEGHAATEGRGNVVPFGPLSSEVATRFAWLGASYYATGFVTVLLAVWAKELMRPEAERTFTAQNMLVLLAGGLLLCVLTGAGSGFRLYRDAVGGARKGPSGCQEAADGFVLTAAPVLLSAFLCLLLFLGRPYLGSVFGCSWLYYWYRRRQMKSGTWFPIWALALLVYALWRIGGSGYAPAVTLCCALPALLVTDALLLRAICRRRSGSADQAFAGGQDACLKPRITT